MEISKFERITQSSNGLTIGLNEFLNQVKTGVFSPLLEKIRAVTEKKERNALKAKILPYVTISGTFSQRAESGLINHSGFICMDFDDLEDINMAFAQLCADKFTYSVFKSASGNGLACLVKIDPKKHRESFFGLEKYYFEHYQLAVDVHCKDISRPRFVSHDENLHLNLNSDTFKSYLPKDTKPKKLPQVITGINDIDYIISQINGRSIDLTDSSYHRFLEIGFALAHEYHESGRSFFHAIAQQSSKYNEKMTDRQFNHCLKSTGRGITIATFFYYCREANIDIISPETRQVVTVAKQAKKGNRTAESAITILKEFDNISRELSEDIVNKVFNSNIESKESELPELEQIKIYIRNNYNLKRNEITRIIENDHKETDKRFFNSIYIKLLEDIDEKINFQVIERLIQSDFIPDYNPLKDWFQKRNHIHPHGLISKLASSINSGKKDDGFADIFITKWLVGLVASVFDKTSPLLLVLTGEKQNTGKTHFLRHLLPDELRRYVADSKLDAGKDDDILMTQKLMIIDDEMGGKSKQEIKRLKELTSKEFFTLREPYGHHNVTLRRIAVLSGTSNDNMLINDPTGNRRIIPIHVESINHDTYNSIDKEAMLMEAYQLFINGFRYQLNTADISFLNKNTTEFEQIRLEQELIKRYFKTSDKARNGEGVTYLQASEIKAHIEKQSGQKLSIWKMGQELKILGFEKLQKKIEGTPRQVYPVIFINESIIDQEEDIERFDGVPF